jgi:hypothetical protein
MPGSSGIADGGIVFSGGSVMGESVPERGDAAERKTGWHRGRSVRS